MEAKDVTVRLASKIKYQVPFGNGKSYEYITYLGDGRVGIVYYKKSRYTLGIASKTKVSCGNRATTIPLAVLPFRLF